MVRRLLPSMLVMALALASGAAHAAPETVELSATRVRLGDVLRNLPKAAADEDLGPAPAPGATRLFAKSDLEAALAGAGAKHTVPADGVRVARKTRRLGGAELDKMVREAVAKAGLPRGVTLSSVRAPASVEVADGFTQTDALVPNPGKRPGVVTASVALDLRAGAESVARLSIPVQLTVSAEAATYDVPKGSAVQVVIARGLVEVGAAAVTASDADVGDVVQVTVRATGRTMRAKLVTKDKAAALEGAS